MTYEERLQNVSVIGAAGKMGSGILLLTALEMADISLKPENKDKAFRINAIDISPVGLKGLMNYLRVQVLKAAEKKTVQLRKLYSDRNDLIENSEIVNQYVNDTLQLISPVTRLEAAYDSYVVFEAAKEDPAVKVELFSKININNPNKPWFFTNTSSIPITELDKSANLEGRIIGFHFYNPPAIQKLVEVIKAENTSDELGSFALQYAKNLRKTVVPSNDVAGFIGNGHFMRDLIFGVAEVERLSKNYPFTEAVYMVNKVSQDYLIRPMGIFQLIDYVGLDVCQYILSVMNARLQGQGLQSTLLDEFVTKGVKGGQFSDGSQKDGFLKYEKGKIVGVYAPAKGEYIAVSEIQATCDERLGAMPENAPVWKTILRNPKKEDVLKGFFNTLKESKTTGAALAIAFAENTKNIGLNLVKDGVAFNEADVNTVLLTGFFHAYGPINDYV
jgi:3-hydroxyacyl-CoA dehydrogenase